MGVYTGTVPTFLAGELPDADKFTEISNFMLAATGAWTDFSSSLVITGGVSNPTKGNSTYTARYRRLGKTVDYEFEVLIGSTFGVGSGTYEFNVPVAVFAETCVVGVVQVVDVGTAYRHGSAIFNGSTTKLTIFLETLGGFALSNTGPGTAWATGDRIRCSITYDAA